MDKFNILVCDDDKAIVDALKFMKQENYNVVKAYTGSRHLRLWARKNPSGYNGCDDA